MTDKSREDLVRAQYSELAGKYPGLSLSDFVEDKGWTIAGVLDFCADFNGEVICDKFQIELTIPLDYPDNLPSVKETGGIVPSDFHINPDGTLCLETPEKIRINFSEEPTLLGFVRNIVIHYFYAFCSYRKSGKIPYGEWSHGAKGRIEFYYEYLEANDIETVLALLCLLADDSQKENNYCPCGSGLKQKKCHGSKLNELKDLFPQMHYIKIYDDILLYYYDIKKAFPPMVCIRKELMKDIQKQKRKKK